MVGSGGRGGESGVFRWGFCMPFDRPVAKTLAASFTIVLNSSKIGSFLNRQIGNI